MEPNIYVIREGNDSLARAEVEGDRVNVSLGFGAYQFTSFTPSQARLLAQCLLELARKAEQK